MENLDQIYQAFKDAGSFVITDTRKISKKGGLFFSLSGPNFNGNEFAKKAIDAGCTFAIVDDDNYVLDERTLLVEDCLQSLQQLASHHRQQFDIPIIAITGSNGKTTTKELLYACFSSKWKTHSTTGNLNNHIGVPLTLLGLNDTHEAAIIEMGTNNPGEIADLARIADPTDAVVTSIGKAHLEGLGSIEGVAQEKLSLFDYVRTKGGQLFCNVSSSFVQDYINRYPESHHTSYTEKGASSIDINLEKVFPRLKCTINDKWNVDSALFGKHNLLNISAALIASTSLGLEPNDCIHAINGLSLDNNRTQTIEKDTTTFYLDAYNANPTSMSAAIQAFAESQHQHKWLILGDMFELGQNEIAEHQSIVELIKSFDWEKVVLVGKLFGQTELDDELSYFESTSEALEWFKAQQLDDKEILIKASRSMKLETLLDGV